MPEVSGSDPPERKGRGLLISFEAAVALIVALINLALDQMDIHIPLISWLSILGCIALTVDAVRKIKWMVDPSHGRKRMRVAAGVIVLVFVAFGMFLSAHKKASAGETATEKQNVPKLQTAKVEEQGASQKKPRDSIVSLASATKTTTKSKGASATANGAGSDGRKATESPATVNNCPNGICISGGTVTNPTVNNFAPLSPAPKLSFSVEVVPSLPTDGDVLKRFAVDVFTDRAIRGAIVGVLLSGPAKLDGRPGIAYAGAFQWDQVSLTDKDGILVPNSVAISIGMPSVFLPGQQLIIPLASGVKVQVLRVVSAGPH